MQPEYRPGLITFCRSFCNAREQYVDIVAFFPPNPISSCKKILHAPEVIQCVNGGASSLELIRIDAAGAVGVTNWIPRV